MPWGRRKKQEPAKPAPPATPRPASPARENPTSAVAEPSGPAPSTSQPAAPSKDPFSEIPDGLRWSRDGKVGTLILSRPDRLNALTFGMYRGLRDIFGALRERKDVRAVVLTGDGRGFCSGGDVEDIISKLLDRDAEGLRDFTELTCEVVASMRACPQPIVAALNGTVAGAGAALALASDIRIGVPEAKIAFLFVKAGLGGADMGAAHLLPRIVGQGRAAELLMLGDLISAEEAHRTGLYNHLVPADKLHEVATSMAKRLADGPQAGIAATKATLDAQASMSLGEALAWDARVQAECMRHPDFREAYEAFRERRKPRFG